MAAATPAMHGKVHFKMRVGKLENEEKSALPLEIGFSKKTWTCKLSFPFMNER